MQAIIPIKVGKLLRNLQEYTLQDLLSMLCRTINFENDLGKIKQDLIKIRNDLRRQHIINNISKYRRLLHYLQDKKYEDFVNHYNNDELSVDNTEYNTEEPSDVTLRKFIFENMLKFQGDVNTVFMELNFILNNSHKESFSQDDRIALVKLYRILNKYL